MPNLKEKENQKDLNNNENAIHIYGKKVEVTKESTYFPKEEKIKKICVGKNHALILYEAGMISVIGDNCNGQLGFPYSNSLEKKNNYIENWFTFVPNVPGLAEGVIIDIACGDLFSLLLIEGGNFNNNKTGFNYLVRLGYKQEDNYKEDIESRSAIVR